MRKHLQPILAATLAGLILLPGLGSSGLLDPWEMDRAASARVVAGPAQVLVVDSDGRLSGALAELPVSARRIETSDVLQSLRLAPNRLSERLSHAVVVDLERLKSKSDNTWREVARQLERIRRENRGTAVVLVSDDVERDQHSLAQGRARQLKRDMRGNISRWLMPEQPEAMAALMTGFERWATPEGWTDTLMAAIPSPWAQVQHKVSRHSSQGPLLDTWLVAGSLSVFGASEFGARLPGALLAMLMAALLFIGMELLFDSKTAWLSVLIYLSLPLTVGNARIVTFAQCAPIGVACTAFGVALGATRKCPNWWLWLTAGLVVLLFGRGLGGLTIGVSVVLGHLIISGGGDKRARWSALFALLALAGAALWVLSDDADPLLRTLRFTQVPFGGGIPEPERDFSTVIGMLGFALYPWGPLFLLAMGQALFADGDDSRQVALRALALAFAAPLLVVTAMFADFHQWTIPVAPVVAAVTAVWLVQLAERPSELRLPMSAIAQADHPDGVAPP